MTQTIKRLKKATDRNYLKTIWGGAQVLSGRATIAVRRHTYKDSPGHGLA